MSPIEAMKPVSLCMFNSGKPPTLEDITGTPQLKASSAASPKLSSCEGIRNKSEIDRSCETDSCLPINFTKSVTFNSTQSFWQSLLSGPSPMSINLEGIFSRTFANTFMTS